MSVRRIALLPLAVVAIVLTLFAASAFAATAPRITGSAPTKITVTADNGFVDDSVGDTNTSSWSFTPTCPTGGCDTTIGWTDAEGFGHSGTLVSNGAGTGYDLTETFTLDCVDGNGNTLVANGYSVTAPFHLLVDALDTSGNVATYHGTYTETGTANAASVAAGCPQTISETQSFSGDFGTVKSGGPKCTNTSHHHLNVIFTVAGNTGIFTMHPPTTTPSNFTRCWVWYHPSHSSSKCKNGPAGTGSATTAQSWAWNEIDARETHATDGPAIANCAGTLPSTDRGYVFFGDYGSPGHGKWNKAAEKPNKTPLSQGQHALEGLELYTGVHSRWPNRTINAPVQGAPYFNIINIGGTSGPTAVSAIKTVCSKLGKTGAGAFTIGLFGGTNFANVVNKALPSVYVALDDCEFKIAHDGPHTGNE